MQRSHYKGQRLSSWVTMTNELIWCPRGWLDGGSGAWAVSRKTPIYIIVVDKES